MKHLTSLLILLISCSNAYSQPGTPPPATDPYYDKSTDTVSKYSPDCIVRHILEDRKGNIWFASWRGLVMYDGKVFTNFTLKNNLIPFHVYSLYEDRSGNIWIGTVRGGAYRYDGEKFSLITTMDGLADNLIGCFMEDKKGDIWIGTDGGVSRLDTTAVRDLSLKPAYTPILQLPLTSKKGITNYTNDGNRLCGDRVNSILQDRKGKMWFATRSGLCFYENATFSHLLLPSGQPFTNVRCVKEDRNGKIWIGGQEGLYRYDPELKDEAAFTQIMTNFIGYVYEDKAGNIWVNASEDKGMALFKYDGKTISKIIEKNTNGDSQVFEIMEDQKGNIWFGTMWGPCCYDARLNGPVGQGKNFNYFKKPL